MTTSAQTIELATLDMHREPGQPSRRNGIVAALCIFAFIASCAMPAVIWIARIGVSAWTDNRPAEPQRLPTCIAPELVTRLALEDRS
jgi:hypothetical protein